MAGGYRPELETLRSRGNDFELSMYPGFEFPQRCGVEAAATELVVSKCDSYPVGDETGYCSSITRRECNRTNLSAHQCTLIGDVLAHLCTLLT